MDRRGFLQALLAAAVAPWVITKAGVLMRSRQIYTYGDSRIEILNNAGEYLEGPSIAEGRTGTWFVSGHITLDDSVSGARATLWDGSTVIASAMATARQTVCLSGFISNPLMPVTISVRDALTGKARIAARPDVMVRIA